MSVEKRYFYKGDIGLGRKAALIIIDFQKMFYDPGSPLGNQPTLLEPMKRTAELAEVFRELSLPVIHSTVCWRADMRDAPYWKAKSLVEMMTPGSHWAEICDEIPVRENDIVMASRKVPSAFFGTELVTVLIKNGCDTLVVTGSNTSGCVRATVTESFSYGFRTIVPEECVGDVTGMEAHRQNLIDMHNRYADVMPMEALVAQLRQQ